MQINGILINFKNIPTNLSNLKSKVDELDVEELVPVSVNLTKPSDVLINEVKGEIRSITNLATTTAVNAKINEVKEEIPTQLARNVWRIFADCSISVAIFGTSREHLRNILKAKIF